MQVLQKLQKCEIVRIQDKSCKKTFEQVEIDEINIGIMPEKGTIFWVKQIMGKYEAAERQLFIYYLEKAFD